MTISDPYTDHTDQVLENLRRAQWHAESEWSNDPATVMETVAPTESLRFSDGHMWVANQVDDDGRPYLNVVSDREGIAGHYDWLFSASQHQQYFLHAKFATTWWSLWDSTYHGRNLATGEDIDADVLSLLVTDGSDGISSELAWMQQRTAAPLTDRERHRLLDAHTKALRSGDVEDIMGFYSEQEYFSSALRPYTAVASPALRLDRLGELRGYYEAFYDEFAVIDLQHTNWYSRDWFLFTESRWRLRRAGGHETGMVTVDMYPLGTDGKIIARLGTGTAMA
ncbi:hypothetical protein [Streptomyces sp. S465]|uniref:hypothetical protein n=1 Tax=Streptomyces sp. S465 TaxID=2979468 RepID=UPI0022A87C4D|nr:hypothetical protein [Streptomyces sp. S465]WAP58170.1 hypothetical protein N6H00_26190 [Streptomyces sp. S465]